MDRIEPVDEQLRGESGDPNEEGKWITENGVEVDPSLYKVWSYNSHRRWDTRWTLITTEVLELINVAYRECGSNWALLARETKVWPRHLRKIRKGKLKVISFMVLDRLVSRSSVSWRMHELPWYTIEELIILGYWKPQRGVWKYANKYK